MRTGLLPLLVLAAFFVAGLSAAAASSGDNASEQSRTASAYAEEVGATLDQALRRLNLQRPAGALAARLAARETSTFAGMWIEHEPQYRIVARFTRDGEETLRGYVGGTRLGSVLDAEQAPVTLADLRSQQKVVSDMMSALGFQYNSGIDLRQSQVELYVTDRDGVQSKLESAGLQLPPEAVIVQVSQLAGPEENIYGGLALTPCTSGFGVKDSSGNKAITTAAHCDQPVSYNGTTLDFEGSAEGG